MIINKLKICGFERVFEGYRQCANENRPAYGNGLFDFLQHSMITIELSDITTTELYYLKQFSSSITIIDKTYKNFVKEKDSDIYKHIEGLLEVHDDMLKDEDINEDVANIDNVLPIGCEHYHVVAIFRGGNISSIAGNLTFADIFKDKETKKLFGSYKGNAIVEENLASLFIKTFYEYIGSHMQDLDLVTDFMVNKKFYQYSESICDLAYVNTPFGDINFFGNTNEKLGKEIENVKMNQLTSPYFIEDKTYMTFVFNTTFNTFMKIYLNTKCIIDHEYLKIIFANPNTSVDDDIRLKYNTRLSSFIEYISKYKKNVIGENTNIDINKFNYIINGNKIKYSVRVSITDFERFLGILNQEHELQMIKSKMSNSVRVVKSLVG